MVIKIDGDMIFCLSMLIICFSILLISISLYFVINNVNMVVFKLCLYGKFIIECCVILLVNIWNY